MPHRLHEEAAKVDVTNAKARAQLALEAGRMGSWTWDVARDVIDGDSVTAELFGLGHDTAQWPRAAVFNDMHPADIAKVQKAMAAAMSHENHYEVEFRRIIRSADSDDTTEKWLRIRAQVVLRDDAGQALRFIGVSWDVTTEKRHDESIQEIAGNMDHRAKNAFAVIRAMINIGKRESRDIDSFADTLRGQVEAMASAHALAAQVSRKTQTPHAPVPILDLIKRSLNPWILQNDDFKDRISLTGEPKSSINSETAASLSMIVQELASNAFKHGALGPPGGTLSVELSTPNSAETLMSWTERFDTPLLEAPIDKPSGFGSVLLIHSVATLKGEITRKLTPDGFSVELSIPH